MKTKLLFSAIVLFMSVGMACAQTYKPFLVGLGLGYASPSGGGDGAKAGALFYFEPAYRVSDQLAIGLKGEFAVIARASLTGESADASAQGSWTLNGRYYFGASKFRPFAGVGLGLFTVTTASVDLTSGAGTSKDSKFGFYPRVGFDYGHFSMNLEYNIVPASKIEFGGVSLGEVKNSYLGVRLGFFIGGGEN